MEKKNCTVSSQDQRQAGMYPKIVGNAVLNALTDVHDFALSFDDFAEVYFVGKKYVLVHITKQYNNIEESIIGTAIMDGNFENQ